MASALALSRESLLKSWYNPMTDLEVLNCFQEAADCSLLPSCSLRRRRQRQGKACTNSAALAAARNPIPLQVDRLCAVYHANILGQMWSTEFHITSLKNERGLSNPHLQIRLACKHMIWPMLCHDWIEEKWHALTLDHKSACLM